MNKKKSSRPRHISETLLFPIGSIMHQVMHQVLKQSVAEWRLPIPAAGVLIHLHTHPEDAEPARLAECILVPRQTMTFALDVLEKKGLASREPHPNDRRKKTITLSTQGRAMAETFVRKLIKSESAALVTFSADEIATFRTLTLKFAEALKKHGGMK